MVETGWVCACGRTNRSGSCPRCGKTRPADAASVPVTGRPGLTKQWFEIQAPDLQAAAPPEKPVGGDATVSVSPAAPPPSNDPGIDVGDPALLDYAYPEG